MKLVKNTSTGETIQVLCRLFATHGVPDTIVSDNDSCFTSRVFKEFATANGIKHITTVMQELSLTMDRVRNEQGQMRRCH